MTHLKSILLLLFSAAALFAASIFFLFEESRDYYRELEVETSASADTRVCLTDAGDGACYLMLPKAEGGEARFVLDGAYSASIDGAGIRSGGSAGALKEGVHTLTIRKRGNPFACRISFTLFREAALPWLYLDFPSGSLYKISQEKGRQETAMLIAMTSDQTEDFADSCKVKVHGNTSWFNLV